MAKASPFKKGRPEEHPWKLWTNGEIHRLYKEKDFPDAEITSLRTEIYRKARELGMNSHTKINKADSSIQVQFTER
jgi:hypothetical protein